VILTNNTSESLLINKTNFGDYFSLSNNGGNKFNLELIDTKLKKNKSGSWGGYSKNKLYGKEKR